MHHMPPTGTCKTHANAPVDTHTRPHTYMHRCTHTHTNTHTHTTITTATKICICTCSRQVPDKVILGAGISRKEDLKFHLNTVTWLRVMSSLITILFAKRKRTKNDHRKIVNNTSGADIWKCSSGSALSKWCFYQKYCNHSQILYSATTQM